VIGVISDTHGLLRPEVADAFGGVGLILHAGDIGTAEILDQLRKIAPVVAVRGNNDTVLGRGGFGKLKQFRSAALRST
jgi:putative phosphoesterase